MLKKEVGEDKKRFPANTTLDSLTFLNDKKINGELYAYLQGISKYKINNKDNRDFTTYIDKKDLPKQSKICEILGIKSPKTFRTHFSYLIEKGFIVEEEDVYLLPEMEDVYFLMPLKTLQYLNDNCKEHVIKIYVFLGQRYKQRLYKGEQFIFTSEELGEHVGLKIKNSSRGYEVINNALDLLQNSGLIEYISYFDGTSQKKKLIKFSLEHKVGNF